MNNFKYINIFTSGFLFGLICTTIFFLIVIEKLL